MEEDVHQALQVMPGLHGFRILEESTERAERLLLRDPLLLAEEIV